MPLGTVHTVTGDSYTVTVAVYAYRQPSAPSAPKPDTAGYVWGSADVQVCVKAIQGDTEIGVSWRPWALIYPDGAVVQPSNIGYRQFPTPGYPNDDRAVPAGRCVRGWVTFEVPATSRPAMVEHQGDARKVLDWTVS